MHVAISWSGDDGKRLADALQRLLSNTFPTGRFWTSQVNIPVGSFWLAELLRTLKDAEIGILVLTPSSLSSQWQAFEAGMLFRNVGAGCILPVCHAVSASEITGPLAGIQSRAFDREGILSLLLDLNGRRPEPNPPRWLENQLDRLWPDLEGCLELLDRGAGGAKPRPLADVLEDLVVNVRSLSNAVAERDQFAFGDGLNRAAEEISCEIRLFDRRTLKKIYENKLARTNEGATSEDELRATVRHLSERIRADGHSRAENLMWDAARGTWRRRRLFDCGYCYWLVDDWEPVVRGSVGADLSYWRLFSEHDWQVRVGELGMVLERELGITRLRLYRVARLYKPHRKDGLYVMQPVWQRGGGFSPDVNTWKSHEYPITASESASIAFDQDAERREWVIASVSDDEPSPGPRGIRFGNATTRADVPVWRDGTPCALLALDRRTDHLQRLDGSDPYELHGNAVTDRDMQRIAGIFEAIKPMIAEAVGDRDAERTLTWNSMLSEIVSAALAVQHGREALDLALERIVSQWSAGGVGIRDAYLARVLPSQELEAWAGVGPIYECRRGVRFPLRAPFHAARQGSVVIHDFQGWLRGVPEAGRRSIEAAFASNPKALSGLGSWFGAPLSQGVKPLAVLVIGVEKPFYFTETRAFALENTAHRLLPMLLWALAQEEADACGRAGPETG